MIDENIEWENQPPLTTIKTLSYRHNRYIVEEFEKEAFERYFSQFPILDEDSTTSREYEVDGYTVQVRSSEPNERCVIEPLKTWDLGVLQGDILDIPTAALEWLKDYTEPLTDAQIEELRVALAKL